MLLGGFGKTRLRPYREKRILPGGFSWLGYLLLPPAPQFPSSPIVLTLALFLLEFWYVEGGNEFMLILLAASPGPGSKGNGRPAILRSLAKNYQTPGQTHFFF